MFVLHRPVAPLACYVDHLWFTQRDGLPHDRERSLPTGRVDIVIPLQQESVVRFAGVESPDACHYFGAVVSGAHDRFAVRGMGGPSSVIGVHFKSGGASAFFGGALAELRNRTELLGELWGSMAADLHERLRAAPATMGKMRILEEALLLRLSACQPDSMVTWALRGLEREPSAARIAAVQSASGCSPQQFIRRFESVVGLTPKRYARVLRFNALLARLAREGPRDWARLAVDGGYFDQSHLIREFKLLAGVTPAGYRPVQASQPTHVPIVSARP